MTFQQELSSWNPFNNPQTSVKEVPQIGTLAPSTAQLKLPRDDQKPVIISFLRHCGCPFAEKAFKELRDVAAHDSNVHCIAVSHSDKSATDKWLEVVGGAGQVEVIVDDKRGIFAVYGLSYSSIWAVLNPWSLKAAFDMGKEGFDVRPTESGSRWQTAGLFAADASGSLTYSHKANTSDDLDDLREALKSISGPKASL